ncbi:MAG: beta-ketoacyl-ACP synthase II [candidate division WOR-3 bacterium]
MHRVAVTGLGVISPVGIGIQKFWDSLKEGRSGISRITKFDPSPFKCQIAGEVKDFNPEGKLDPKEIRRFDLFTQYALYTAIEAIENSGLVLEDLDKNRVGVIYGSGIGGENIWEEEHKKLIEKGPDRISPFFIPALIINMAAGLIAMKFGFKGVNYGVVSACASSGHAIGEAFRKVRSGEMDVVITGGSEAPIGPLALAGFSAARSLSTRNDDPERASRPFDKNRDGFVMSEGAGTLVLENFEHAKKRGASIYAEIVGYGATDDAFHITAPDETGGPQAMAMERALEDGGIRKEEIDYINAHGTSTLLNDKTETKAIKRVFGERAYEIKISSTKSMVGHLLGAASAIEAIATILSLKEGIITPTINYEFPDEECDLDYTPNKAFKKEIKYALSNSFGFGGHNVTLAFKKVEES